MRLWIAERLEPATRQQLAKVTLALTANYLSHKTDMDFVRNGEFVQYAVTCMSNMSPYNAWTGADKELEAKAYFYLGRAYWVMGALSEAQVLFKKSKASSEILFGPKHPWTLWSCNNLAIILIEQRKYDEACEYAQLAVAGMTDTFGAEHEETLVAKANLSTAEERRITEVPMNVLMAPPEDPLPHALVPASPSAGKRRIPIMISNERLTNKTDLDFWTDHGYHRDGRELYQRLESVLNTFEHGEGNNCTDYHKFFITGIHFYATLYVMLGNFKRADQLYEKALRTNWKTVGLGRRQRAESIVQLNSSILNIIYQGYESDDRRRGFWLSGATTTTMELQYHCGKDRGQSLPSFCRDVVNLLPDLSKCQLVDYIGHNKTLAERDHDHTFKNLGKLLTIPPITCNPFY